MAYDESKDKCLFEKEVDSKSGIVLSIHQYNGGEKKLQIGRVFYRKDGSSGPAKLGRLTLEEFRSILSMGKEIESLLNGGKK